MKTSLAKFHDEFSRALFTAPATESVLYSVSRQPGFAVYRNTVMKGCIDALQANYPTVARLVGDVWFRAAASAYVEKQPPQDPRMLHYGGSFPDFLAGFEPAADLVYLPGVAQLDRMWTEAHAGADEQALEPADLSGCTAEQLGETALYPHATARWAWFEDQPIYTIWARNRELSEERSQIVWKGEGALLVRPHGKVLSFSLNAAGCAFLDACKGGEISEPSRGCFLKRTKRRRSWRAAGHAVECRRLWPHKQKQR